MGALDKPTKWIGEQIFGIDEPKEPTRPPDPTIERAKAEEEAQKKIDERRRRIQSGGRKSTMHALGSTQQEGVDTLGA